MRKITETDVKENKTEVIDRIIKDFVDKGEFKKANNIIEEMGSTNETRLYFLNKCIKKGRVDDAKRMARTLGKKLSQEEIDMLSKRSMIRSRGSYSTETAIRLGASKDVKHFFLKLCWEKIGVTETIELAKLLDLSGPLPVIKEMVKVSIEKRDIKHARQAATLRGDGLGKKEYEQLIENFCIEGDIEKIIKIAGKNFTDEQIDKLVWANAEKGDITRAWEAASLRQRLKPKEVEKLKEVKVKKGSLNGLQEIAELANIEVTKEDYTKIIDYHCDKGNISIVERAAKKRGIELSYEEADKLVQYYLNQGSIDRAQKAAELRRVKLKKEEIKKLIRIHFNGLYFDDYKKAIEITGKKITQAQRGAFVERLIQKLKEDGWWEHRIGTALKVATLGIPERTLDKLILNLFKLANISERNNVDMIKEAFQLRKKPSHLTGEEFDIIIKPLIDKDDKDALGHLLKGLEKYLTAEQINRIAQHGFTAEYPVF